MQKKDKKFISLIGYRGTGKSSIANALSKCLSIPYFSVDEEIKKQSKKEIYQIIKENGWNYFRKIEAEILENILYKKEKKSIIDCGGGIILKEQNRTLLKKYCFNIYLRATPNIIYQRILNDNLNVRPSLTQKPLLQEIIDTLKEREILYYETSNITIDTNEKDIERLVKEIINIIQTLHILL